MRKGTITNLCGIYAPAVAATLSFLKSEMQEREEAWQRAKSYKKNSIKKITYNNIDEIMSFAFGPSLRYMDDIRRYYFNPEKSIEIRPLKSSSWDFKAGNLKEKFTKFQIDMPEKINEIQRLCISTLTVAEVLSKDNTYITANIKDEIRRDIKLLYSVLETNYGTQYWKVVFKYFLKCVDCPSVKDLIVLLPQCKSSFIDNWIRQLSNGPSSLYQRYRNALEEGRAFLKDYSKELLFLNNGQGSTPCTWEEVFYSFTVEELLHIKRYVYLFRAISKHKLRANDLNLAYLVETQLSDCEKELFYDELANEINFDGVIAWYCQELCAN